MRIAIVALGLALAAGGAALAQQQNQTGTQAGASGNSSTSVSANKGGANAANSSASATNAHAGQASTHSSGSSEFGATLSKPVDGSHAKPGDPVSAETTQDMNSADGVKVPKGSMLVGHVTEVNAKGSHHASNPGAASAGPSKAEAATNENAQSTLGIVFDHAVLKGGHEVPVNASIQALGAAETEASGSAGKGCACSGASTTAEPPEWE